MYMFERGCLTELHGEFDIGSCFRKGRLVHPEWIRTMKSHVYPHNSDVDWDEYCDWVRAGQGLEEFTMTWHQN